MPASRVQLHVQFGIVTHKCSCRLVLAKNILCLFRFSWQSRQGHRLLYLCCLWWFYLHNECKNILSMRTAVRTVISCARRHAACCAMLLSIVCCLCRSMSTRLTTRGLQYQWRSRWNVMVDLVGAYFLSAEWNIQRRSQLQHHKLAAAVLQYWNISHLEFLLSNAECIADFVTAF